MKTSAILLLACLLMNAACDCGVSRHIFGGYERITYPPSKEDRPHKVRNVNEEDYNRGCIPQTSKCTIIIPFLILFSWN